MSMYVMTGVHGSHVLIGLIALTGTLIQSSSNALYRGAPLPIQSGTDIVGNIISYICINQA